MNFFPCTNYPHLDHKNRGAIREKTCFSQSRKVRQEGQVHFVFFNTKALKVFFAFLAPLRETGLIRFCDCRVPRNKLCGSYPQGVQGIELLSLHQLPQTTPQEPGRYQRELVSYPEPPQIIADFWFIIITTSPISKVCETVLN